MRASTLLGLAIALFLGVTAVAAVRYSGILERTPAAPPKTEPPVMVLTARGNVFEGTALTSADALLRPATSAELKFMADNPDKLLPPYPEAVHMRVLARSVAAGQLFLKDQFLDLGLPPSVSERITPGMLGVDLVLPRERAAGGLMRTGEYVDVLFTTTICSDPSCSQPRTAIAPLAQNLKIIVKRDNPWTVVQTDPPDKPISFILEANPYRAALIEFAKTKGFLSLNPSAAGPKKPLLVTVSKDEQDRVSAFMHGKAAVGEGDLERIFNLQQNRKEGPEPPLLIEHYNGTQFMGVSRLGNLRNGKGNSVEPQPSNFSFFMPGQITVSAAAQTSALPTTDKYCPTCGKNGKK